MHPDLLTVRQDVARQQVVSDYQGALVALPVLVGEPPSIAAHVTDQEVDERNVNSLQHINGAGRDEHATE
ncbi:hypothetical protein [Burkholderia pseudomallei]|uniref:hypothetical protein n=1 Tax=Burkholderia pseudomallei TaxID=28450 RepID=UPI0005318EB2|nr:hypothetical protein [Burkholderia pseudomallei]KGS05916.1 hypothetical protein X977_3301 [Burkholderia pseudomallei MSHR7504]